MIVRNHLSAVNRKTGRRFDTLLVSHDDALFKQLSSFLREFEPERRTVLIDDRYSFASVKDSVNECDIIICDLRVNYAEFELGAYVMDCVPSDTLIIGLTDNNECSPEILNRPQHLRLGGIIDNRNGWFANWHQIAAIGQAWHNPLMVSRIEEVPVSDVLQMISSGRWNTIIHIEGHSDRELTENQTSLLRGCISFYQGEPQTAWSWRSAGIEAIFDLLSMKRGVLQVIKNICAPTIRNVFLQTEEILLSHAVALDESASVSHSYGNGKVSETDLRPEAPSAGHLQSRQVSAQTASTPSRTGSSSWWRKNGERLIEAVRSVKPQSLPLRRMSEEEFLRIRRDRAESGVLLFYGNEQTLMKLFCACSSGFSSEKGSNMPDRFPVLRLGRSGEQCLYLAAFPQQPEERQWAADLPAALFVSPQMKDFMENLRRCHCGPLLLIADSTDARPHETPDMFVDADFPVGTVAAPDFSWGSVKTFLTDIISTMMKIT